MIERLTWSRPATSRSIGPSWAVLAVLSMTPAASAGEDPHRSPVTPPPRVAPSGAEFLERAWPDHPEWLAMLADIFVVGDRISGDDGWFRKAVARTRFDWKATSSKLDADGNGTISRSEFAGSDADFARLDRHRDGDLSVADFDFTSQPPSTGSLLFTRADRDGNGKVTREEFEAVFRAGNGEAPGYLSQSDFQEAFISPPRSAQRGPTRSTFLKSFVRGELGAFPAGPSLDETAPDFSLRSVDGKEEVTLSKVVGPKPVVLVFGNFSCAPFRGQAGNLEKLHQRYRDRATFLMVYVREAHPIDGWRMEHNDRMGVAIRQPRTDDERRSVAQACNRALGLGFPMLVDTVDDAVNDRYSGLPSRLYLIDRRGKITFKGGRGPFGFKPAELEHSLILLLDEIAAEETNRASPGPR